MRNLLRSRFEFVDVVEAALAGVFFVSALRYLIGALYSRLGGMSVSLVLEPSLIAPNGSGVISASEFTNELNFLFYMLALSLLALFLGRYKVLQLVGIAVMVAGRVLMVSPVLASPVIWAVMVVGGGLIYLVSLVRYRAQVIPYLFVLGLGLDQIVRASGNTLDPTWSRNAFEVVLVAAGVLVLMSLVSTWRLFRGKGASAYEMGLMSVWGALGMGALLYLELGLLSTPNAVASRASSDYTNISPFVTLATILPVIPWVRSRASSFLGSFDRSVRGWLWMLVIMLLLVFGLRFQGILAAIALVTAQFMVSLIWWWLVRPRAEKERLFTGLWVVLGIIILAILVVADTFTFEYAYVQGLTGDLAFLNPILSPVLRGFRGLGLGVVLFAVFIASLPTIQAQRRLPWSNPGKSTSFMALVIAAVFSLAMAIAVRPPSGLTAVRDVEKLRIGTYNIHSGFNEFFTYDLEAIARTIQQSGANVVLLQQIDTGRLTSFGVDQPLWLARRLSMDRRYFPTNEGLQGLAVLSNVEFVYDDGILLSSIGNQTGLQRVQVRPDAGVITLYNTRLEFLLETGNGRSIAQQEQDQQRQLNELLAVVATHYPDGNLGRTIIGGTFNNVPGSPIGDQMRAAGFADPFAGLPVELSATLWRTGYPRVQLDYLWVWRRARDLPFVPVGANTINSSASDHRMAVIEILIREPSG